LKVLLTGADGFTGRHFIPTAAAAGHEVVSLKANLGDKASLTSEVTQIAPEVVVHLAAISYVGHANDSAFYTVNVIGTTNLLEALLALPVKPSKVLLASSANIYGNCNASPIEEAQPPAPVNHYATSKLAMEYMARTFAEKLPIVITRPFNYTGPGQRINFVIPKIVDHFARRAPSIELGNLIVEREFNDVQTVCSIYLELLKHALPGEVYNVCTGQPYTLQVVIEKLVQITGHQIEVQVNPSLIRANELHHLCGSPNKLKALLATHDAECVNPPLANTLRRMLASASLNY
jgi:nucleoside-diphosphate-sugar epimerase